MLYGAGFFMGLLIVFFFLGGKKASCNWLPNDRILNLIRKKELSFQPGIHERIREYGIDSTDIIKILQYGDVDFSNSQTKNDPCRFYLIEGSGDQKDLWIKVDVCDSIATVSELTKKR